MKPKAYVMVGISGSGKSSVAGKIVEIENCEIVSSDIIRKTLTRDGNNQSRNNEIFNSYFDQTTRGLNEDRFNFKETLESMKYFDQKNPYHPETFSEHSVNAAIYFKKIRGRNLEDKYR